MEDLQKMRELRDLAIGALKEFLSKSEVDTTTLQKARIALTTIGTYSRTKQSARTWASMKYLAARELIENKDDLEQYVVASLPELQLNKIIAKQQDERKKLGEALDDLGEAGKPKILTK